MSEFARFGTGWPYRNGDFLERIAHAMPAMIAYWDRDLICRFANRAYLAWFGKSPEALIGTRMVDLLGAALFQKNQPFIAGALAGEYQVFERTLVKHDGSTGHTLAHYVPDRDERGEVRGFCVLVSDVTEMKHAEARLRLAARVFESTSEGIIVCDGAGRIVSVNPAASAITQYDRDELIGASLGLVLSGRGEGAEAAARQEQIATAGHWQGQVWHRRKSGEAYLAWQTTTTADGSEAAHDVLSVHVFSDITELWRRDEQARRLAFQDSLTELPNRALFTDRLEQAMAIAERERRMVALLFLDLDGFKAVNDTYGHAAGDDLLREVAARLRKAARRSDSVARLGGDEFVILLTTVRSRADVGQVAAATIERIGAPIAIEDGTASVGVSIGAALYPDDAATPAELLRKADLAMYAAKRAGRHRVSFADEL